MLSSTSSLKPILRNTAMSIFTILFLLLISTAAEAQRRSSNITLGSSLTPSSNSSWPSPSGVFAFGFFPQHVNSYAVGIFLPDKTVVWTANRDSDPTVPSDVVSLILTPEGRLVLRRRQGQDVDVISPNATIALASMLDNGNFVLYDSESRIIWQSFDHPTDTLLPGQRLQEREEIVSSASETDYGRGNFRLKMQHDGNLVQYPVNTPDAPPYAYYGSQTNTDGNVSLNLGSDGRLYLLLNDTATLQNLFDGGLPTQGYINLMRLDVGGIFRIYSLSLGDLNLTRRWSSTDDECAPKGICGINAFCILLDNKPECQCLPGFFFPQSGNYAAGCSRNFSVQGCSKTDNRVKYDMRTVENTAWEDSSYEILDNMTSEEDCSKACLDDCNCEAAFFKDNSCLKQKLPLRFGRRSPQNSSMALIRYSTNTVAPDFGGDSDRKRIIKNEGHMGILIIGIVLISIGVLSLSISVIFIRQRRKDYMKIGKEDGANFVEGISLQVFTFEHLSEATNGFKEELGRGASGTVFKGVMQNGQKMVAVKRLEKEFAHGEIEFQTELKTIGKMYHRNLVRLLGYCFDGDNKLLVFEFMSNGSLADILFNQEKRLKWEERMEIAQDISRGILYLHQECETQIIHCDIKPQNILMDDNRRAKISDFGLAKLLKQDQTNTITGIRGTKGYVAPEWFQKQAITVKADVYSFGVVLLEIICCRKCVDHSKSEDEAILEEWVYDCYTTGKIGSLVGDDEMVDESEVERMVEIGIWCVQYEPSQRPTMKNVLLMLEGIVEIPVPPNPSFS
ncbi:G-type lectin S-receptor-like serine/threonine-protein kinase LECRK3 [Salvia splendens]|uniref:G-type lectin S-receptor-like serine/threonine-protein kinase LECRK3 n=1 Tax=Salvia splendens TaxID=180675 RepID=UPI001C25B23C|nr:G-type lectin S-receptor-like serine/threonine-protein kinase LECRK3 [Salvia splendens]